MRLLIALALSLSLTLGDAAKCDQHWELRPHGSGGTCYLFVGSSWNLSWPAGMSMCRQIKSTLATLQTTEENVWMYGFRALKDAPKMWTGGFQTYNKTWSWRGQALQDDSEMNASTFWATNHPEKDAEGLCMVLSDKTGNFRWEAANCGDEHQIICEKPAMP